MKPQRFRRIAALAGALALAGCAMSTSLVTGRNRAYAYSWADEVRLGQETDRQMQAAYGLYDDPALTAYVTRVGEQVLATSHLRRPETPAEVRQTPVTFRVLDSEVVNAFALPGGYVYVTRGLLSHVGNEAELALVLGHEVGHVAARHSSQEMLKQQWAMIGLVGLSAIGEELWGIGEEMMTVGGVGATLLLLRYGRDAERESDALGVEYATLTGYRAEEGARFFALLKRMQADEGGGLPGFLSTHPDPGQREVTIGALAGEWRGRGHDPRTVRADAYLAALDGMVLGPNVRKGYVDGGVFYHPDARFRVDVPAGWEVAHEGGQVQFSREQAQAMVFHRLDGEHATAAQAAAAFVAEHQLANVAPERTGAAAGRVEYTVRTSGQQDGETWQLRAHFVEMGGRVHVVGGLAPDASSAEMGRTLSSVVRSLATLRDERALRAQPARIRIVPAPRTAAFRSLLPATLPRGVTARQLARMNGVEEDAVIQRGTPLKLPR